MRRFAIPELERIRSECFDLAPGYYFPQADALEALETGVGNCFAKAMIACGIVAVRYSVEPSVAYSERLHGTLRPGRKPLDPRSKKNMAHIAMVLPGQSSEGTPRITGLDFGIRVFSGEKFSKQDEATILEDYNAPDDEIVSLDEQTGEILPTGYGRELGVTSGNWQRKGQSYLSKIDRPALDFDRLLESLADKGISPQEAA